MSKVMKVVLITIIAVLVLSTAFGAGCIVSWRTSGGVPGPNTGLINQVWNVISQNYVEPSGLDYTKMNQGAVRGIVQSLEDPYSAYLTPADYALQQENYKGSFGGIGAQVSLNDNDEVIILAPVENSPAAKAGLKSGDIIQEVDGKSVEGLSLTEAVLLVRGEAGTTVKLKILPAGETTSREIDLVREVINAASVSYSMRGNMAYIKITNFDESTEGEFEAALQSLDLNNAAGLILDLRDNPGGLVSAVVDVASHFIKEGVIITLRDNQGRTTSESVKPKSIFIELPVVVLVNQHSASGSEVLAGALQDYKRATIAGVTTVGKGSYNAFFALSDQSAVYLTIGRWLTPDGREIEGNGITPDETLTQTGDDAIQWAVDFLNQPK